MLSTHNLSPEHYCHIALTDSNSFKIISAAFTAENWLDLCNVVDEQGIYFLQSLAINKDYELLKRIIQQLPMNDFLSLMVKQNENEANETLLHVLFHLPYEGENKELIKLILTLLLDEPAPAKTLDKLCLLKDGNENSILLCWLNKKSDDIPFLIKVMDKLTDETFNKLLLHTYNRKNNIFQYLYSYKEIESVLERAEAVSQNLNSENFKTAVWNRSNNSALLVLSLLHFNSISFYEINKNKKSGHEMECYRDMLIRFNLVAKLLKSIPGSVGDFIEFKFRVPFIYQILMELRYCGLNTIEDDIWFNINNTVKIDAALSDELQKSVRAVMVALFENISYETFIKATNKLKTEITLMIGSAFLSRVSGNSHNQHSLNAVQAFTQLMQRLDYIPYQTIDPAKTFNLITFTMYGIPDSFTNNEYMVKFNQGQQCYQYERFIRDPAGSVVRTPKVFVAFYIPVIDYQLLKRNNNQTYIAILSDALKELKKYPQDEVIIDTQTQLENMLTCLLYFGNSSTVEGALNLVLLPEISVIRRKVALEICEKTALTLPDTDIRKAILQLNALHFDFSLKNYMSAEEVALQTRLFEVIENLNFKNWEKYLGAFKDYIDKRKRVKPVLFSYSADDLKLRIRYFDSLKAAGDDLNARAAVLADAIADKNLNQGVNHECLNILKSLNTVVANIQYLQDKKIKYLNLEQRSQTNILKM